MPHYSGSEVTPLPFETLYSLVKTSQRPRSNRGWEVQFLGKKVLLSHTYPLGNHLAKCRNTYENIFQTPIVGTLGMFTLGIFTCIDNYDSNSYSDVEDLTSIHGALLEHSVIKLQDSRCHNQGKKKSSIDQKHILGVNLINWHQSLEII